MCIAIGCRNDFSTPDDQKPWCLGRMFIGLGNFILFYRLDLSRHEIVWIRPHTGSWNRAFLIVIDIRSLSGSWKFPKIPVDFLTYWNDSLRCWSINPWKLSGYGNTTLSRNGFNHFLKCRSPQEITLTQKISSPTEKSYMKSRGDRWMLPAESWSSRTSNWACEKYNRCVLRVLVQHTYCQFHWNNFGKHQ